MQCIISAQVNTEEAGKTKLAYYCTHLQAVHWCEAINTWDLLPYISAVTLQKEVSDSF